MKILKKLRNKLSVFMRKFRFDEEENESQDAEEGYKDQFDYDEANG